MAWRWPCRLNGSRTGDEAGARQAAEAAQATGTLPEWMIAALTKSLAQPPTSS